MTARYVPADCPVTSPFSSAPLRPDAGREPEEPPVLPAPADPRVDLNVATAAELDALPGIGPALAERIVAYRARRPYRKTSDLMRVRGIGPATFRRIADRVKVGQPD